MIPIVRYNDSTHVAVVVIYFRDGGAPEEMLVGQGSLREMENLRDIMPAVSYGGDRPVERADFVIAPWSEVEARPV